MKGRKSRAVAVLITALIFVAITVSVGVQEGGSTTAIVLAGLIVGIWSAAVAFVTLVVMDVWRKE
jgi:hypothetical protein